MIVNRKTQPASQLGEAEQVDWLPDPSLAAWGDSVRAAERRKQEVRRPAASPQTRDAEGLL